MLPIGPGISRTPSLDLSLMAVYQLHASAGQMGQALLKSVRMGNRKAQAENLTLVFEVVNMPLKPET